MPEIDLEPHEYRQPLPHNLFHHVAFKRATWLCAGWFGLVVGFGRLVDHGLPWWVIAAAAFAPLLVLTVVVVSLDEG